MFWNFFFLGGEFFFRFVWSFVLFFLLLDQKKFLVHNRKKSSLLGLWTLPLRPCTSDDNLPSSLQETNFRSWNILFIYAKFRLVYCMHKITLVCNDPHYLSYYNEHTPSTEELYNWDVIRRPRSLAPSIILLMDSSLRHGTRYKDWGCGRPPSPSTNPKACHA